MTAPACLERHARRKAEIVDAIAGQLARWGQGNTYDSWLSNCEQEASAATAPTARMWFLTVFMSLEVDPDSEGAAEVPEVRLEGGH